MFRFGFFCSTSDNALSSNRSTTLKHLNWTTINKKTSQNASDLKELILYSLTNGYTLFRIGNSFVPFISHSNFDPSWLTKLLPTFKDINDFMKEHPIRLSMHPGQYTLLNSPKEKVKANSLNELKMFFWILDNLYESKDNVIVLHVGGVYDDKELAMERFYNTVKQNSWLKKYLVIENDEHHYTAKEVKQLCTATGVPMIFDIYHHKLNPSDFTKEEFFSTWQKDRRPKVHISSKGEGRFGKHADFIEKRDFDELCHFLGDKVYNTDIMIEAKKKEKAIQKLRTEISLDLKEQIYA